MGIIATAQVDVFDVTDGYTCDLSSPSLVFSGAGEASVTATMMRGSERVACTASVASSPNGVEAVADGATVAVRASEGFSPGPIEIDVAGGGVTLRKSVPVAIAPRGKDGRDADPATVERIETRAGAAEDAAAAAAQEAERARKAASAAEESAGALRLLVRETPQGVEVGASDGSGAYPKGRTRQSGEAFEVLGPTGSAIARLSKDTLKLIGGRMSVSAEPYDAGPQGWGVMTRIRSSILSINAEDGMDIGSSANSIMRFGKYGGFSIESSDTLGGGVKVTHDEIAGAFRVVLTSGGKTTTLAVTSGGVLIDGERVRREKVLYTAPAGANGFTQPTLSESAASFDVLEIFFHDNDGNSGSCRVCAPNGKRATLHAIWADNGAGGNMWIKSRVVSISGTSVKTYNNGTWNRTGDAQINNGTITNYYVGNVTIDRIVGYR